MSFTVRALLFTTLVGCAGALELFSAAQESRIDVICREFDGVDEDGKAVVNKDKFTKMVKPQHLEGNSFYYGIYHDVEGEEDRGYFLFEDSVMERQIFVTCKEVGRSKAFHDDKDIKAVFDITKPNSNHEHYFDMRKATRRWARNNLRLDI